MMTLLCYSYAVLNSKLQHSPSGSPLLCKIGSFKFLPPPPSQTCAQIPRPSVDLIFLLPELGPVTFLWTSSTLPYAVNFLPLNISILKDKTCRFRSKDSSGSNSPPHPGKVQSPQSMHTNDSQMPVGCPE